MLKRLLVALPVVIAVFVGASVARAGGPPDGSPAPEQVRRAIERSLPFLDKGAIAWATQTFVNPKVGKGSCVSCHQVPFTMWVDARARACGFKVDQKTLDHLADWSLDFCAEKKYESEMSSGLAGAMVICGQLLPAGDNKTKAYELFATVLASQQLPDGTWMNWNGMNLNEPGFQIVAGPRTKRPHPTEPLTAAQVVATPRNDAEKEAIAVDTMWAVLSLDVLEKIGDSLAPATLQSARESRRRALEWLDRAPTGERADWLASRMLIDRQRGKSADARRWKETLLLQQHADGGWGLLAADASHPFVTGQCLYTLGLSGLGGDDPAIRQACNWLLGAQRENGSWKAGSRNYGMIDDVNRVTTHWSTAWAALGLLQTLPAQNPVER